MKFQVREGFVAKIVNKIDLGDGKFDYQENTVHAGQTVDLSADQADLHAHKLEPKDKAAEAYLAAKVMPQAPAETLGLTVEQLALVKGLAAAMAQEIVAAIKPAAAVTA